MKNSNIRLTEQDLHRIVEASVINILRENGADEGALWNAFKGAGKNMANSAINSVSNFGRGMANVGRNMRNTYQAGRQNEKLVQQKKVVDKALNDFVRIASQLGNAELVKACRNCINQLDQVVQSSAQNVQNVSQNTFSTKNQNQGM